MPWNRIFYYLNDFQENETDKKIKTAKTCQGNFGVIAVILLNSICFAERVEQHIIIVIPKNDIIRLTKFKCFFLEFKTELNQFIRYVL